MLFEDIEQTIKSNRVVEGNTLIVKKLKEKKRGYDETDFDHWKKQLCWELIC